MAGSSSDHEDVYYYPLGTDDELELLAFSLRECEKKLSGYRKIYK